jgi:hypothetical protein
MKFDFKKIHKFEFSNKQDKVNTRPLKFKHNEDYPAGRWVAMSEDGYAISPKYGQRGVFMVVKGTDQVDVIGSGAVLTQYGQGNEYTLTHDGFDGDVKRNDQLCVNERGRLESCKEKGIAFAINSVKDGDGGLKIRTI